MQGLEGAGQAVQEGRSAVQGVGCGVDACGEEVEGDAPVCEDREVGEGEVDGAGLVGGEVVGYYVEEDGECVK